ncbi:GDSL-like Lipase/Acylhydrolase family protein [compost metagenome]
MVKAYTYLALGDSYTIGESVPLSDAFPHRLTTQLAGAGLAFSPPKIIATTGWTTDELQAAIKAENIQEKYDLVTLLIGVNNQYRGYPLDTYRSEFADLLAQAIGFAGQRSDRVFVLSIPDWGLTPFGQASGRPTAQVAAEIDAFNEVNRRESEKKNVVYTDITPGSRKALSDPSLVAIDGLHYAAKLHEQWASAVLPKVLHSINPV